MDKRILALIAAIVATSIFGFNHTIAKELMPNVLSPNALLYSRVLGAAICFWFVSLFTKREKVELKDFKLIIICAIFGMGLNMITALNGLYNSTPINSSIITTLAPIFIFLISVILLKEKISKRKYAGVFIGFIGTLTLILLNEKSLENAPNINLGNFYLFINSISYALYFVLVKPLTEKYNMITIMKWLFLFSIFINMPFGLVEFMQVEWVEINNTSFIKIFYVVFCTTFLVYLLNLYALKNLKATTVGMFIYLQPVIGILFAIYRGADKLTIPDISSVLLVFAGVYLVSKKTTKAT
ncbi:MAG: EamA family transporter [Euryarchaeota archaeon TMED97]|jgi:drug/metabolite transporter (DMT)-like permease|nr:MAG: EamA family transporter [Euryarchaeota archaeon TMED97]|tara:strand:+ start:743 stop:1636 length:894 start_codon:yes stop_codon:yes gene_type:complete